VVIDDIKNETLANMVKLISDKSKTEDLFMKLKLEDDFVFDQQPYTNQIDFKIKRRKVD